MSIDILATPELSSKSTEHSLLQHSNTGPHPINQQHRRMNISKSMKVGASFKEDLLDDRQAYLENRAAYLKRRHDRLAEWESSIVDREGALKEGAEVKQEEGVSVSQQVELAVSSGGEKPQRPSRVKSQVGVVKVGSIRTSSSASIDITAPFQPTQKVVKPKVGEGPHPSTAEKKTSKVGKAGRRAVKTEVSPWEYSTTEF